jgi:hypothetical protein
VSPRLRRGRIYSKKSPVDQDQAPTVEADRGTPLADSFAAAFEACEEAGVVTIFRDQAPKPGSQVAVWLPGGTC